MDIAIKRFPETLYLMQQEIVTKATMGDFIGRANNNFCALIDDEQLHPAGEITFFYLDYDGCHESEFTLQIGYPVTMRQPLSGKFFYKCHFEHHYISYEYMGPMQGIRAAWDDFYRHVLDSGYQLSGENREIYKKWVDFDSQENVTDLQLTVLATVESAALK